MDRDTLFISDLHLDPERPAITRLFLDFLAGPARAARALYILGDLFEAWVGDDDDLALHIQAQDALAALSDAGVPVRFMRGNRDFLVAEGFARRTGAQLLADPTVIDLDGIPTLLMHGDTLCTDDIDYQRFRAMVHDPAWQADFLSRSLAARRALAHEARDASRAATRDKTEAIMDVNAEAVVAAMRRHRVRRLIHGHTHRQARHALEVDGEPAERIVLGDWYRSGNVLRCRAGECVFEALEP